MFANNETGTLLPIDEIGDVLKNHPAVYHVDAVQAVSTIGAGDNFNAGLIYGLIKNGIGRDDINNGLKPEQWDSIIATAQMFAAECCKDISNSVSVEFGKEMKL